MSLTIERITPSATLTIENEGVSISVSHETTTIEISQNAGPQGPAGQQGPAGVSSAEYLHTQAVASALWSVPHNLGRAPNVELRTVGGLVFVAEILHTSPNNFTVNLTTPTAGTARCT